MRPHHSSPRFHRASRSLLAAAVLALPAAARAAAPWGTPACEPIQGTAAVTYTKDAGLTLTRTADDLRGNTIARGLVALDRADTLLAAQDRTLLRSKDAGCTWQTIGTVQSVSDGFPIALVAARGGRAFAWADQRPDLARIDELTITYLKGPDSALTGLATDAKDGNRLRAGGGNGQIHESRDAGKTWARLGVPPPTGSLPIVYRTAFDPRNLDHAVVGSATTGALVTFDGGATWAPATGLSPFGGNANVFSLDIAPGDGNIVWAEGLDLADPALGRHVYRSEDGGLSFVPVADQSGEVILINGPLLVADPRDTNVAWFVFGSSFGAYGTDLYRYDHSTGQVTKTHNGFDEISAIEFHPTDPAVMYLGLTSESIF